MKAIYLIRNGESTGAFEIREAPIPTPDRGELVIRVEASGLNYADVMARRGLYKAAPPIPCILGYDVAGTVHSIGRETPGFKIGQRVAALTRFGGYAEYAKTDARAVIPIPEDMDASLATSLATQASTAIYSSMFATRLYGGDHVLVHAAAGGVGSLLVQIAKSQGCIVYGSSSPTKHGFLKEIGADFTIDSRRPDYWKALSELLEGRKLDVIFDNVGGNSFKKGMALLGSGGRFITYGAAAQNRGSESGRIHSLLVGLGFGFLSPIGLIVKSQSILGVNMLALSDHKPATLSEVMKEAGRLSAGGILRPVVGKSFPYHRIHEAHDLLESRNSIGKIAITW